MKAPNTTIDYFYFNAQLSKLSFLTQKLYTCLNLDFLKKKYFLCKIFYSNA